MKANSLEQKCKADVNRKTYISAEILPLVLLVLELLSVMDGDEGRILVRASLATRPCAVWASRPKPTDKDEAFAAGFFRFRFADLQDGRLPYPL